MNEKAIIKTEHITVIKHTGINGAGNKVRYYTIIWNYTQEWNKAYTLEEACNFAKSLLLSPPRSGGLFFVLYSKMLKFSLYYIFTLGNVISYLTDKTRLQLKSRNNSGIIKLNAKQKKQRQAVRNLTPKNKGSANGQPLRFLFTLFCAFYDFCAFCAISQIISRTFAKPPRMEWTIGSCAKSDFLRTATTTIQTLLPDSLNRCSVLHSANPFCALRCNMLSFPLTA